MAKPRVFISSTYYDLKYIRVAIEEFVNNIGYESILFEKGSIPFQHDKYLEESCVSEVNLADIFILILGGRYGSLSVEDNETNKKASSDTLRRIRCVTEKEYDCARGRGIPIFIFVDNAVLSEYKTFQKNRGNDSINYAHVDDTKIFELIEGIFQLQLNNYVKGFDRVEEIVFWLRDQWAGLFAESLRRRSAEADISKLSFQISQLGSVVQSLQSYSELLIRQNSPNADELIEFEKLKQRERLEDAIIEADPISWFIAHDNTKDYFKVETKEQKNKILNSIMESDGLIEFLDSMDVKGEDLIASSIGVEGSLSEEFLRLKRAISAMLAK